MSDYSESKIYMIYIPGLEDQCYIGSTVESLPKRLSQHRMNAQHPERYQFASHIFFQEGNEVHIKLLEAVDCETKAELLERERYWLDQFPEAVNRKDPICDDVERHERQKATQLQCYYNNREERIAKHKAWIEAHKEEEAEKKRQRRLANLEEARAKDKASNAKRKEAHALWKKQKVICSACKKEMTIDSFGRHKKTIHPDLQEVFYTKLAESQ